MIEIEKKFHVSSFDAIRSHLAAGKIEIVKDAEPKFQSDEYFNHRQLRFELQDIALRIREVDGRHILTFKGPNQDATTKIRTEVEVEFSKEDAGKMSEMFLGMGMHSVAKVSKTRDSIQIRWQGTDVEVCLDSVEEVGCFVELEIVVESDDAIRAAKEKLESLADTFGLKDSITTSYLEMLLKARGQM